MDCADFNLSSTPIPRESKMIRKDDQPDRAENLTQRELRQREHARDEQEEKMFAELARSPWGQCVMRERR